VASRESPGAAEGEEIPAEWQRAFRWVEDLLGGRIVRRERQARWRPAWLLDLERDGRSLPLYFRGDRGRTDHGVYPLEHELRVLRVLEAQGIPVPHVYGLCPDPRGILLERCPGRANLATAESPAEREAVLDHYIELLARMHRIDPAAFEAVGLARPRTPEALGLGDFDAWERSYRRTKRRPEPLIEFVIRWLRRNAPRDRERVTFLTVDSGQFLFEGGRVTAVLDLELACLGDPLADLAGLRCRDLSEPLGDLPRALRRYAELTGEEIDCRAVDYHTARFGICTPMVVAHLVADPPPDLDLAQYLSWYLVYSRAPLEAIAHGMALALEPIALPEPEPTRHAPAHGALEALLSGAAPCGGFEAWRAGAALRLAQYLRRADRLGPALDALDRDEAARLLRRRPPSAEETDARLEELVLEAGPERDADLVRYFHRRVQRQEALLGPALRELEGALLQPIDGPVRG